MIERPFDRDISEDEKWAFGEVHKLCEKVARGKMDARDFQTNLLAVILKVSDASYLQAQKDFKAQQEENFALEVNEMMEI